LPDEDSEMGMADDSSANKKAELETVSYRPVVFVLEDLEMFSSQVMEDLIVSLQ